MTQSGEPLDPKALPSKDAERRKIAMERRDRAYAAMQRNEPLVASLEIADAVMLYPNDQELLGAFDRVVYASREPLSLFPVATGAIYVATAAARARVLARMGRLDEAVDLLGAVIEVAPHLGYVDWMRQWLEPRVLGPLGWDRLLRAVIKPTLQFVLRVAVPTDPTDARMPNLQSLAPMYDALRAQFPNEKILFAGSAMLRRRLDDVRGALTVADEGVRKFPDDWGLRTALMNALSDAKLPDDALTQARAALQIDPQDFSPLHDAGHAYLFAQRPEDALKVFEELLQRDPRYPGGQASLCFARYQARHTEEDKQTLIRLRDRRPWDDDVVRYANVVDSPIPCITTLTSPLDAAYHYGRELIAEIGEVMRCCGQGASLSITLQSRYPESPSAFLAFDVAMRAMGAASATMSVENEKAQNPDPRADKGRVNVPLFQFDGRGVHPVFTQADPRAQQAVANVAFLPFSKFAWDQAAQQVAEQAGPGAAPAVFAVITNPPAPPPDFDGMTWTFRCQIAAAVILSHMGPWSTGPARAALYSLVSGPSDWATIAGIIAFSWRATDSAEARAEVDHVFGWLRTLIPHEGFCPWESALAEAWYTLENPTNTRAEIHEWMEEIDETLSEKNSVRPLRRYGGMTIEEYARFSLERDRIQSGLGYPGMGRALANSFNPPPALVALCQKANLRPNFPFIGEWQEALNANPSLMDRFLETKRTIELKEMGVSDKEKASLDNVIAGNMDMHQRMAQAQQAQTAVASGNAGDPDPVCFPGQPVAKLSDYVKILKGMQTGNMQGALAPYGLTMMTYGAVATAWSAKMTADPTLMEKFSQMMK